MKAAIRFATVLSFLLLQKFPLMAYPMNNSTRVYPIAFDGQGLFAWAKCGTLLSLHIGQEKTNWYLYCTEKEQLTVLTGNLSESTKMISAQLDATSKSARFLRDFLADVALSFFGPPQSYIINDHYIVNRAKVGDFRLGLVPKRDIEKTLEVLERYRSNTEAVIKDNSWNLRIYVTTADGGVEMWNMDGAVFPFAIDNLQRTTSEPAGTVVPMPEI